MSNRREGHQLGWPGVSNREERHQFEWAEVSNRRDFKGGAEAIEQGSAPRTTEEEARLLWQLMQHNRVRDQYQIRQPESPRVYTIRDDEPLGEPDESLVFSGQLEPCLILHACPMTVESREFLYSKSIHDLAVINPDGGGSSGGAGARADGPLDLPEELGNEAACAFSEKLCQKSAKDWAAARVKDDTVDVVMTCIENDTSSSEITEEGLGPGMDVKEAKRLVARGEIMELPSSNKLLVQRLSRVLETVLIGTQDSTRGCSEMSQ